MADRNPAQAPPAQPSFQPPAAPATPVDSPPVYIMPEEQLRKIQAISDRLEQQQTDAAGRPARQRIVQQIPVQMDTSSIMAVGTPTIVQGGGGPMVVYARKTKLTLYRADGTPRQVPAVAVYRYLNKRDEAGNQVFFQTPPVETQANTAICRYCFKKFRPSTDLERAANAAGANRLNDPEVQALLKAAGGMDDQMDLSINDAEFKLAEHIRARHGRQAAFIRDPILMRLREETAGVETGPQPAQSRRGQR